MQCERRMEKEEDAAGAGAGEEEVVVPIDAQKHDPAWKHCLMVRCEGRVRLKCAYCGKHFLGGGIHRFKEHLARRPGNACYCPKVPRDVQDTMLRSLDSVAAKKMQRKLSSSLASHDIRRFANAPAPADATPPSAGETENPIHMIPLNEVLDFEMVRLEERPPESTEKRTRGRVSKKKRKAAVSHASTPPLAPQTQQQPLQPTPQTNPLHQVVMAVDAVTPTSGPFGSAVLDKEQVCMAIGRFL